MESLEMLLAQCSRRFLVGIDVIDSGLLFYHTYNHTRMLAHRGHTLVEIIRKQPTLRNMISIMGDTEAAAIIAEIESYLKSNLKKDIKCLLLNTKRISVTAAGNNNYRLEVSPLTSSRLSF